MLMTSSTRFDDLFEYYVWLVSVLCSVHFRNDDLQNIFSVQHIVTVTEFLILCNESVNDFYLTVEHILGMTLNRIPRTKTIMELLIFICSQPWKYRNSTDRTTKIKCFLCNETADGNKLLGKYTLIRRVLLYYFDISVDIS